MKKSFMTRVMAVTLSTAMVLSLSSASSLVSTDAAVKKLPANAKKATVSLKVGKSTTLKLKSYKTWNITKAKSNKKAVAKATLKKGNKATVKVAAKKAGKAVVTLTLANKKNTKSLTKKVTVKVTKAAEETTDTPTDTTPTDTTPTETPTDSAVKVTPGALSISSVTAAKVDTLVVSFSSVVSSTGAVSIKVTKGEGSEVETKGVEWNADANAATITTTAKMTKGTYTVTATDGKDTTTGTVEITNQEVKEIKFLNETALTGNKGTEVYVYYDVLDQYGESMKDTVSIQWTASTGINPVVNRAKGKLTIKKSTAAATTGSTLANTFTYGDKVYLTGVYTKTGVTNSSTFSVGTAQSVDKVNFVGFLKKGSTTIEETLPSSFKANQYKLLYNVVDQNGNELDAGDYVGDTTGESGGLTVISDNVLVVEKVTGAEKVTLGGTDYCAAWVVPGSNVNTGGTVNLSAISTKTGQKSTLNFVVGAFRILKKFEIGTPSDVVADGESVDLSFTATDANGEKMTNFLELAAQSEFSKLSFSTGEGTLKLSENADGSAKLTWSDGGANAGWRAGSTDGIDRPISLTAIVVGGETSNQMLYVSDKARPDSISDVDISGVMLDDSDQKLGLSRVTFLDQYGRNMKKSFKGGNIIHVTANGITAESYDDYRVKFNERNNDSGNGNKGYYYDNGFFAYANANANTATNTLTGTDFSGYNFYVKALPSGFKNFVDNSGVGPNLQSSSAIKFTGMLAGQDVSAYKADFTDNNNDKEATLKFTIYKEKYNDSTDYADTSKALTKTVKFVSINNLSSFTVADLSKQQIETQNSDYDTGELAGLDNNNIKDPIPEVSGGYEIKSTDSNEIKVKGVYNGSTVDIPSSYFAANGDKLKTHATVENQPGENKIKVVKNGTLYWKDLYDATSSRYLRKDAKDTLTVEVYKQSGSALTTSSAVAKITKEVLISDATSAPATFTASDTVTINPANTGYTVANLITNGKLADAASDKVLVIKDQYGTELYKQDKNIATDFITKGSGTTTFTYLVKDIEENKEGYVSNNISVSNNAQSDASISGLERGDKFTVEITATIAGNKIIKAVKVTVGSDDNSKIEGQTNCYTMNGGLKAVLQDQLNKQK